MKIAHYFHYYFHYKLLDKLASRSKFELQSAINDNAVYPICSIKCDHNCNPVQPEHAKQFGPIAFNSIMSHSEITWASL